MSDWQILPREKNLSRVHDPIKGWTMLTLVERHLLPDTWTVIGPSEELSAFVPGGGCILYRGEEQIDSGKLTNLKRHRSSDPKNGAITDTIEASFTSDLLPVGQKVVIPSPLHTMSTTAVFNFPGAYDLRSGAIETLIINYVRAHAGDLAQADRRVARLRMPTSLGRGGTTQVSARFDQLGVLMQTLAEAGNLRYKIVHTEDSGGAWLDFVIEPVSDLSSDVRFGTAESTATGIITDWSYEIGAPTTTRSIVAGGGELAERDMLLRRNSVPETLWGMAPESLVDQRQVAPLGTQAPINEAKALIQQASALVARSHDGDQRLRSWIAGSPYTRTAQLGWSWLVEWDRLREADLTVEFLSDLSEKIRGTTADSATVSEAVDTFRTDWGTVRQVDDDIRTALNEALIRAWEGPSSELAHAAAITQATNLLDTRITGDSFAAFSLYDISTTYQTASTAHWNTRAADTFTELARGGDEALDEGAGLVKVQFTPTLGPDLEYRRDVRVGDIVGYDLPGLEPAKDKIREVTTVVTVQSGTPTETVSVVVGTPDAPTSRTQQQTARALRGVTVIQRST